MPRALNLLRATPHYRRDAFGAGLQAAGFDVVDQLPDPSRGDAVLIWNRYGGHHERALAFERAGGIVFVAENSPLGNDALPSGCYSLALGAVAIVGGRFPSHDDSRLEAFRLRLGDWTSARGPGVVFGQRGIGSPSAASPRGWAEDVARRLGGRVRPHPGTATPAVALESDLASAEWAATWASAAAIRAIILGVPVHFAHPGFVLSEACEPISAWPKRKRDDRARLGALRRLAWCIHSVDEIRSGDAFRRTLAF